MMDQRKMAYAANMKQNITLSALLTDNGKRLICYSFKVFSLHIILHYIILLMFLINWGNQLLEESMSGKNLNH